MSTSVDRSSNPCANRECVPAGMLRFYNFFRAMILGLLLALLLALWGRSCQLAAVAAPTIATVASTIEPGAMTLSGQGPANGFVDVVMDGELIGEGVAVDANGNWSLQTSSLDEGDYSAVALWNDPDGAVKTSDAVNWTVAASSTGEEVAQVVVPTDVPTAVPTDVPTAVPTDVPTAEPTLAPTDEPTVEPTVEPTAEPTLAPTAEPTPEPTEEPTQEPTAEPTPEPTPEPTTEASASGSGGGDGAGDGSLNVVRVASVEDAPTIGAVGFGMSGTGRPGAQLVVLENGVQVGGALVQEDGTWSCTCTLPPGEHILVVQDANDPSYTSEEITFVVENLTAAPTPPAGSSEPFDCSGTPPRGQIVGTVYIVAQCEYADLIAERLGTTVEELLAYNPQLQSLSLIYPGQALNIPSDAGCFDDNHNG